MQREQENISSTLEKAASILLSALSLDVDVDVGEEDKYKECPFCHELAVANIDDGYYCFSCGEGWQTRQAQAKLKVAAIPAPTQQDIDKVVKDVERQWKTTTKVYETVEDSQDRNPRTKWALVVEMPEITKYVVYYWMPKDEAGKTYRFEESISANSVDKIIKDIYEMFYVDADVDVDTDNIKEK